MKEFTRYSPELGRADVTPYAMMMPRESGGWLKNEDVVKAVSELRATITRQAEELRQLAGAVLNNLSHATFFTGSSAHKAVELSREILNRQEV